MEEGNISIDSIIKSTPIALSVNDQDAIELAYFYLPYSTGFEIECCNRDGIPLDVYNTIPYLIEAPCEKDELKFRIPNGIKGLHALFRISNALKEKALLNPNSGIHYHVDFSEDYHLLNNKIVSENSKWILEELDTWGYKGTFNKRRCEFSNARNYTRFKNSTKTMEFRIGEMTFRYELLFQRIVHVNDIVRRLKAKLVNDEVVEEDENFDEILKNRIIKI